MELYRLVVTMTCFVCLGFSGVMCSEFDPLIETYVSSSQLSIENLVYSGGKLKDGVHSITESEWDSLVIKSELPVMVVFIAQWSGPCHVIIPILNKMDSKYKNKFKFYAVNIDLERSLAERFGIKSVPTTFVFKGGDQMAKVTEADPTKLLELVKKYMSSSQLFNENLVYSRDVVPSITESEWDLLVIRSELPVMVVFIASWCTQCRAIVDPLYALYSMFLNKFKIYTVDIEDESSLAERYDINALPTNVVFKGGDQMAKVITSDIDVLMALIKYM